MAEHEAEAEPTEASDSFSQAQVNSVVAKARREERAKHKAELQEAQGQIETLRSQVADLERVKGYAMEREREFSTLQQERDQVRADLESLQTQRRNERAEQSLTRLFEANRVVNSPRVRELAVRLLFDEAGLEIDEDGGVQALTIDGERLEDVGEGVKRFFAVNDWAVAAPPSGPSPSGRPNGGTPARPRNEDRQPVELVEEGLKR